jgi:N-acetylglucosaminyl-diphospho-decaprenol L-rhamnosyltransferase
MTAFPISVIVLNYNTRELTLRCLALFAQALHQRGWQIIVVDNGSSDGSVEAVQARYPFVKIVRSKRNLGFAGGNNLGLRQAAGRVVFLMNSDVLAAADTLQALAHQLDEQPAVGIIAAGLRTAAGEAQAFAYGDDPTLGYLLRRGVRAILRRGPLHRWDVDQPIEVQWVSGACLAVRREIILHVGLLDERFQLYFEDNDWCLRARQAGWKVVYDPRFTVTHLGGQSQPQRPVANQLYYQSMIKFYSKHYGAFKTLVLKCLLTPYQALIKFRSLAKPDAAHRP